LQWYQLELGSSQ